MTKIIVMLIWTYGGSMATITGFETVEACQEAIPAIQKGYLKLRDHDHTREKFWKATCVELPRGDEKIRSSRKNDALQ